jgi:L-cysteine/cystine lyase
MLGRCPEQDYRATLLYAQAGSGRWPVCGPLTSATVDELRSRFPVLRDHVYLNAGTCGPLPDVVLGAAREALEMQVASGRWLPHFETRTAIARELRELYARALGAPVEDVALTNSTSEGLGRVLAGLGLGPGDEVLTSDEEHIGVIGPLVALQQAGVTIRLAPLETIHEHVTPRTTLVVCCHVGWLTGKLAPGELAQLDVPVLYDGAQGVGAVPLDMSALGCAVYAGPGQKWLCGADGTGMLYIEPSFRERVRNVAPGYLNFENPNLGLDSPLKATAERFETSALSRESLAVSLAATRLLSEAGLADVQQRGAALAARLADMLAEAGRTVGPRGATTLVAFEDPEPTATRERLNDAGIILREMPNSPYLRASVGAWNDESDLTRLVEALA